MLNPKSQLIMARGMAFMLEIFIPNAVSWYLYPSPTSMGLGVFILIYLLFRDGMAGQSIAKKLLGLTVIDLSTGKPCGPLKSFQRNLILIVPFSPLVAQTRSKVTPMRVYLAAVPATPKLSSSG